MPTWPILVARPPSLGDFARPIDFAKRPEDQGQVGRNGNAEVLGKTKGKLAIALRIKDRERAFKRNARICKISRIPVRGTVDASSEPASGDPGRASTSPLIISAMSRIGANARTKFPTQRP